ncbi:histidine kinase [Candidatus Electronema halotolerans]|jgi:signal transduction histidine kinase/DNA-binding response OmpR family regulator
MKKDSPIEFDCWQTALKLFDTMGQHALLLDSSSVIKAVNRVFIDAVGLSRAELIGQPAEALEAHLPGIGDQLAELRRNCPRVFYAHLTDKNGTALLLEMTLARVEEQDRDLIFCTGRRLRTLTSGQEASLRRTEQQLMAANRLKRKFIANINHAIRTPMNAIIGYAEILAESSLSDQHRRFVNSIRKNGASLVSIINDVMELSKLETGNVKVLKSAANLRAVIGQAFDLFADQARAKKLHFSFDVASHLPEMYVMDADHCRQVLTNLISNSIKFTDKGSVSLTVTGCEGEPGMYDLLFRVEDTGCGISAEEQADLLKLFSEEEQISIHDGTRLGLTLCARLARMMGGSLELESALGQGCTFIFQMPAQTADKPCPTGQAAQQPAAQSEKKRPPVMLVVDDMPEMSHLIKIYFSNSAVKVLETASCAGCLALCRTEQPDLILMDLELAGTDGRDIARQLKDDPQTAKIPIVVMTGLSLEKEELSPLFDDYLAKPFHLQELQRVVNRHIPLTDKNRAANSRSLSISQTPDAAELRQAWTDALQTAYLQAQQSGNLEDALALGRAMEQQGSAADAEALTVIGREMKRFALDMDIRGVEQVLTVLSKVEKEN